MNGGIERYLILARFGREYTIPARICLLEGAGRLSVDAPHLAFTSEQGDTVGLLVRSEMTAAQIVYSLTNDYISGGQAFLMVMEITSDWSAVGAESAWEWLCKRVSSDEGSRKVDRSCRPDIATGNLIQR